MIKVGNGGRIPMHMMKADVMVDIHARNNHIAEHVHEHLAEHKIFAVNIMGAPGAGKTTTDHYSGKPAETSGCARVCHRRRY